MKATMQGETTFRQGIKEQLQRASAKLQGASVPAVGDMEALYAIELQELHSSEIQLADLLDALTPRTTHPGLVVRLDEYATELRARHTDLHEVLRSHRLDPTAHADDAMISLVKEAKKMAQLCAPTVRDAAVAASIQRIIHYKISSYGTIAAYAKILDRFDEAGKFAGLADRDKAIDAELSDLAKSALNPRATSVDAVSASVEPTGIRPH
jgi:ferritin-like metal-binding protein YciE